MKSKPQALAPDALKKALERLPQWKLIDGKLNRDLRFVNFIQALSFINEVAVVAEDLNHHPEWSNVYDRVHIALITHDAAPPRGAISKLDLDLAYKIDAIAETYLPS
jgi:4a-hydroxytetrahydrobiopterin dehydratase